MKRLALIGSKEFARQIRSYAEKNGEYTVIGYFDDFENVGSFIEGLPVLGKISDAEIVYKRKQFDCIFCAAGYNNFSFRENVFNSLKGKVPFANIINPSVSIGKGVILGEGIYIGANSYIADETVVQDNVFIHAGTTLGHNNTIGSHTYISGRFDTCGYVNVGKRCFIGVRCLVSDHVTICDDTWLGIGSLVLKNIEQSGKYMSVSRLMRIE